MIGSPEAPRTPLFRGGAAPALQIRTFGDAEVWVGDQRAEWHSLSARNLFFYLLSFPEGRGRDEILNDLWGLSPCAASTNRFRVTLHRVRVALGSQGAVAEAYGRYHLAPDVFQASDVHTFYSALQTADRARSAEDRLVAYARMQAVYSGEYLPQVRADWAQQAREEHRAAYVQACMDLSALRCLSGACSLAVSALSQAVKADPYLGENHHQTLMTCLSVVSGASAAVEHYRRFIRFLRDDLNDTPMPDTVALAERLKAGEFVCARGQQMAAGRAPACTLVPGGRCSPALRQMLN